MDGYLTSDELAERLKVTRKTIDRWRKDGLPYIKVGRLVRFEWSKVESWIMSRNQK
ncbi:helix-turn-helix transcriptional regulator [Anaeroselena agilis]|uniref:Helix-turn-helix domain-containing protein n=1 Tax=Anaeroselena agilis TaxID=3063788 RepID=A0ABU3NZX2_9FIRM|nr:helix-turn-helix domain-containing protein [Selenomonadales bacterium 4137-cl]